MRWGETLIDVGSLPTEVVCPSGFKPSVTPSVYLIFIGSFFGYSTQLTPKYTTQYAHESRVIFTFFEKSLAPQAREPVKCVKKT